MGADLSWQPRALRIDRIEGEIALNYAYFSAFSNRDAVLGPPLDSTNLVITGRNLPAISNPFQSGTLRLQVAATINLLILLFRTQRTQPRLRAGRCQVAVFTGQCPNEPFCDSRFAAVPPFVPTYGW